MPAVTVVYWRDIPAQVIVGKGRAAAKRPLPVRFEKAIDRAAMKSGLAGTDDYLGQWRRAAPVDMPGEPTALATSEAARIDAEYSQDRLQQLIDNEGRA
jgi:Virulence factor